MPERLSLIDEALDTSPLILWSNDLCCVSTARRGLAPVGVTAVLRHRRSAKRTPESQGDPDGCIVRTKGIAKQTCRNCPKADKKEDFYLSQK